MIAIKTESRESGERQAKVSLMWRDDLIFAPVAREGPATTFLDFSTFFSRPVHKHIDFSLFFPSP